MIVSKAVNMFPPLFASQQDYDDFKSRHARAALERADLETASGKVYLGVDAGSTTVKTVLLSEDGKLLFESYQSNSSNPVPLVKAVLEQLYARRPDLQMGGATVTGYGEDLIRNAFHMQQILIGAISTQPCFTPPNPYSHLKELAGGVIGYGSKMGEGWLLTAEMLELAEHGYENIVCTQPFGCLPNHINGKGMCSRAVSRMSVSSRLLNWPYSEGAGRAIL